MKTSRICLALTAEGNLRSYSRTYGLWFCLLSGVALAAGSYTDFLQSLATRESSGNDKVINQYGYAGLYQMGEAALIDAGYYLADGTQANDWQGSWTGKNGINSLNDFLNNSSVQTQAITGYHEALWNQLSAKGLTHLVGQTIQGIPITPSGLIAAAHLLGAGSLSQCLKGGACTDGNNVSALSYLQQLGGYDVTQLTGSMPSTTGTSGSSPTGTATLPTPANTQAPFTTRNIAETSAAFAAGAGVTMAATHELVLGVLSMVMLLWAAWVSRASFSSWRNGKIVVMQMQSTVVSSLVLLSLVLFIALA